MSKYTAPLPEWATPGTKATIYTAGRWGSPPEIRETTITRRTKTSVFTEPLYQRGPEQRWVMGDTYGYRAEDLREYGRKYGYGTTKYLLPMDHPDLAGAAVAQARQDARTKLRQAINKIPGNPTIEDAEAAQQAIGEFLTTMHALENKEQQ